ncbi:MAG: F0F1 ATP synthase subunit B [Bacilli bacterium]|nr:F0F1 ATP synthase subunit B [Bacilli bacterium]
MKGIALNTTLLADAPFNSEEIIKKLVPNGWSLLINLLALIVLFIAVYLIAYKPLRKYLDARKDYIEKNIHDSEHAKQEAESTIKNKDAIIREAHEEAAKIVEKAKVDGERKKLEIVEEAEAEATRKLVAADEAIKQEEAASREALRQEIVDIAMDIATTVLPRELNEEDNKALLDKLSAELEEKDN